MHWLFNVIFTAAILVLPRTAVVAGAEPSIGDHTVPAPTSSFGDFDSDGQVDAYSVDPVAGDHLYRSRGDGTFIDVTEQVGLGVQKGTRMVLWHDFDGNGTLDLYVCAIDGRSRLFQNLGHSFADVTVDAGIAHQDDQELFAEWIDCDGDGLSDLHVVTNRGDRLFRNVGRGRFGQVDLAAPEGSAVLHALVGATGISQDDSPGSPQSQASACADGLVDQAEPLLCIQASSIPELGKLTPLSRIFSISGANVGIRTAQPTEPLDIALGDKSFQIRRDGNLVPGINLGGVGGNVGILRLRNALEIWPDDAQTRSGYLDVRGLDGAPRLQFEGGNGQATFRLGDKILQIRNDGNLVPGLNLTGTGGNLGILRLRNRLEIWPDDAQTTPGQLTVADTSGAAGCFLSGTGDAWFLGNVGIGTTSPTDKLDVVGGINVDYHDQNFGTLANALRFGGAGSGEGIGSNRGAGSNQYGLDFFTLGGTVRMSITSTGDVGIGRLPSANRLEVEGDASKTTAGSWLANSDRRIKTDVREIQGALATLDRVHPVAFRYTEEYVERHPTIESKEYYNVISQEFAEVFPDYVKDSGEDGIQQVDTYPALIHSIAAVRELHEVVQQQEQEIATLQDRLTRLESSFATLSTTLERQR